MAYLDVGFEWPVCDAGYRLRRPRIALAPKGRHETLLEKVPREDDALRIVAKGKGERLHRPLEIHPTLYLEFAKLDGTDQSCLEFANRFGLLGLNPKGRGEAWVLWQDAIISLAKAIELSQSDRRALEGYRILPLHGALRPSPPDGRLVFRLSPSSLLHAMHLQFVHAISSGLTIKVCRLCGKWFEAGGDLRRRDAQFCSKEHKVNYFNLEKRRGAP